MFPQVVAAVTGRPSRRLLKAVLAAPELAAQRRPGPRILIYHQIGTDLGREMEVSTETFAAQIDYLQAEGSIVSLDDALARMGEPGDDRLFVLTFDDGYADMYTNAYPLLETRSIPFTLYITTQPINDAQPRSTGASPLSWKQVADMQESGLATIGAHTHSHPDLRFLAPEALPPELDTSNALISGRLGVEPKHFAYPFGWWSAAAEPELRKRYTTAVLGEGPPNRRDTSPHRLHRVAVQKSDGMRFFKRKLATGLVLEDRLRRRVRGYEGPPIESP
jgi:peptidoglycan/xylan/chitin deacetylase (PgdA/CDA1 family)